MPHKDFRLFQELINLFYQPSFRRTVAATPVLGFTIVELLIVIVVIGVLAAIVIVAYTGITSSARVSSVKSDLTNMSKQLELYKAQKGIYPTNTTTLDTVGLKPTQSNYDIRNNLYYIGDTAGRWYAIGAIVKNIAYCLESGSIHENAGNACNSYANTSTNVRNQATAAGVDGATISLFGGTGYDDPADGAGNGWQPWME